MNLVREIFKSRPGTILLDYFTETETRAALRISQGFGGNGVECFQTDLATGCHDWQESQAVAGLRPWALSCSCSESNGHAWEKPGESWEAFTESSRGSFGCC